MKTTCPYCNYKATNHETLRGADNPKPREISFCINCGEFSQYTNEGLEKVDVTSLNENTQREINRISDAWLKMKTTESVKGDEVEE